ncbi:hexokinase [Rhizoctonia solani AG-1 IA]|uniref:Phosphotransferase n=1 Tax=Thanatephorus cucumeris (strain AG1-IA) TaxID=983506 RepID=L8WZM9_THACA|nr:hexokinase [Rhizoctonia solani AG-1 IA]
MSTEKSKLIDLYYGGSSQPPHTTGDLLSTLTHIFDTNIEFSQPFASRYIMPPPPSWSSQVSGAVPETTRKAMASIEESFFLSEDKLKAIEAKFVEDFRLGYSKYGEAMAMIPTFVTGVPNGSETGYAYTGYMRSPIGRVCEVILQGNGKFDLRAQKFKVSTELKTGTATALFDYIASCVDAFLNESSHASSSDDVLSLGLTFSFPVEQTALDRGKILTWTKGFSATGAVGHDVVVLLQDALDRKNLHVKCTTVGTLLSHAYATGGCLLGAIFGTGTNGAFVEKTASFTKMGSTLSEVKSEYMVVNTEWGAFDNERAVLDVTPFDNKLDRESINPLCANTNSLLDLGEITRNILLYLIDNNMLFSGRSTAELNKHYGFDTALMSAIESDTSTDLSQTRQTLVKELNLEDKWIKRADLEIVRWACQCVGTRAALLSGVAVAATIKQTGVTKDISVGIDGRYAIRNRRASLDIKPATFGLQKEVKIGRAKDGSGVGAALCALQASKQA